MTASIKVISYEVRRMCSPNKQNKIWLELRHLNPQIVMLQETHFTSSSTPKMPTHVFNQCFLSPSPFPKARGVAIAIHKNCPFLFTDSCIDQDGRFAFVKGQIQGQMYTFATIYAPNLRQITFIDGVLFKLVAFQEGILVFEPQSETGFIPDRLKAFL